MASPAQMDRNKRKSSKSQGLLDNVIETIQVIKTLQVIKG